MTKDNKQPQKLPRFNFTWLYIIAGAVLLFIYLNGGEGGDMVKPVGYTELKECINKGYVSEVKVYDNDEVEAYLITDSAKYLFPSKEARLGERPMLTSQIGSKCQYI